MGIVNVDVGSVFGGLFGLIDELFTSDEERDNAKLRVMELAQKGRLAQIGVNLKEAEHRSLFVAGWRPFVGWVCGLAFAYNFIIYPFMQFVAWALYAYNGTVFPAESLPRLDLDEMMPVLMGMLGLGAMRSYEKRNRVAANNLGPSPRAGVGDEFPSMDVGDGVY